MKIIYPIKSVCPECNHIERFNIFTGFLLILDIIVRCAGFVFLVLLIIAGPMAVINTLVGMQFTGVAVSHSEELRELALNYTTYDGGDSFTFAYDLVENMPRIRYVMNNRYGSFVQDSLNTLEYGGDCKNSAILFTGLMMASGFYASVECSFDNSHCVTRVPHLHCLTPINNEYMIVDLTSDSIYIYDNNVDFWAEDAEPNTLYSFYKK